jgi:hypothetical protein
VATKSTKHFSSQGNVDGNVKPDSKRLQNHKNRTENLDASNEGVKLVFVLITILSISASGSF